MPRSFSILLAEPNLMLRDRIAGVLVRNDGIWCVVQVEGRDGLVRVASRLKPDFILADLTILKNPDTVRLLRRLSADSRIIALTDSQSGPYMEAAHRLGLDGTLERGRVGEGVRDEIRSLSANGENSDGETS